ncbi:MAG: hypothetical protein MIO93_03020 [ANME-2 cluster archaeon]|jgi:predicted hydrocarbon binding protein|nr:hypothetical protein [ANME-2 cluster archaeon]
MVIRKHISIEKKDYDKIKPFLTKHEGNFSAAIRDIIDLAIDKKIALDHSDRVMLFDSSIANYLLIKTLGIIPDKEILSEIADPSLFNSVSETVKFFNVKFKELDWKIELSLDYDTDNDPTTGVLTIKGEYYPLISLCAKIMSLYLAVEKHLGIDDIHKRKTAIELIYKLRVSEEVAINDLNKHLGIMQDLFSEIEKKPGFWQAIVKKYRDSNYKTIAVHKDTFEELLANEIPVGEIGIELIAKRHIKDIPHREFLYILKEVYETSMIAENVDIEGDTVKVFHNYKNPNAVNTLEKILLNQFKANGHTYIVKSTRNLIIFQHLNEMGMKILKIIEKLNRSNSSFDKEIVTFLTYINNLEQSRDSHGYPGVFGYTMSKRIFKEYAREHDISEWDIKTFQEAFSTLDSKIGRISEWENVDNNSVCYTVNKCSLAHAGGEFNTDMCQLVRGLLRGAIEYTFKEDVKIKPIKQLTHGDEICECHICFDK